MKKYFLLIVVLLSGIELCAQTSDNQESSLIIALDIRSDIGKFLRYDEKTYKIKYYYGNYAEKSYKEYYASKILEVLSKCDVKPYYVSGVLYGKKTGVTSPASFSKMVVKPTPASDNYVEILSKLYNNLPTGEYYSITSFARPYSLMALKNQQSTNRTFLIILTDGKYNGNDDYYGEAEYMKLGFSEEGKEQFMKDILSVQTNYFCQFKDQVEVEGGHLQLYEFIPLQQYFALESVLDFPHRIEAKRGKSKYIINFNCKPVSNSDYEIKRLQMSVMSKDKVVITQDFIPLEDIKYEVDKKDISDTHIEIKAWVQLRDSVYNNTILHPAGSKLQGAAGLQRSIRIDKEENAKILGIVELPDILFTISFWTTSQAVAATIWGWIFICIIIVIIILIIYKSNIYKVKEGTTKI